MQFSHSHGWRFVTVISIIWFSLAGIEYVSAQSSPGQDRDEFSPVTDAMLQAPSPGDWLMWRRTLNGWGYSPLDQINRDTVANLQFAKTVEPNNPAIAECLSWAMEQRAHGLATVPSTLAIEMEVNPFLRAASVEELAERRTRKDSF